MTFLFLNWSSQIWCSISQQRTSNKSYVYILRCYVAGGCVIVIVSSYDDDRWSRVSERCLGSGELVRAGTRWQDVTGDSVMVRTESPDTGGQQGGGKLPLCFLQPQLWKLTTIIFKNIAITALSKIKGLENHVKLYLSWSLFCSSLNIWQLIECSNVNNIPQLGPSPISPVSCPQHRVGIYLLVMGYFPAPRPDTCGSL